MTENTVKKVTPKKYEGKKQEGAKKHEGIKKYEKFILGVCNVEHFSLLSKDEKDGYYGVAILLAYQEGAKPNLKEFAYRLRVTPYLLETAFNNLRANGVFSSIYKKKVEPNPKGLKIDMDSIAHSWMNSTKRETIDWCWVAGIGSGLCGLQ